jgi:aspartate racemase
MTKILGIVGGIGPESTIDYYRSLVATWKQRVPDGSYPRLIINCVDLGIMLRYLNAGELDNLAAEIVAAVERLARAGADVALLAANTPHLVFERVASAASIPMISIVEETRRAAESRGMKRVALFGTRFTMQAPFYPEIFRRAGIDLVTPTAEEQDYIHDKYMNELIPGIFLDETRTRLESIIAALQQRGAIDGLILGGTELPLILKEQSYSGVGVLDTTRIHVESAIERMLA